VDFAQGYRVAYPEKQQSLPTIVALGLSRPGLQGIHIGGATNSGLSLEVTGQLIGGFRPSSAITL